jgi:predicted TIM-barrel fold metal-dependent hydrolase
MTKPYIVALEEIDLDRIMFSIDCPAADKEKLLNGGARRFLKLKV